MNSRIHLREMQSTMVISSGFGIHFATAPAEECSRDLEQGVTNVHEINSIHVSTSALGPEPTKISEN
ncbi:hypothetical protein GYMLUDRAFT_44786 [Collybiopsis luxurians FD-317 M1]|uniref:Uncharacterized protein n=1 Tax=Collybiopsis luxurians FD-317 M1 TaxID=944289 RepID=A0A0D0B6M2_9AGAR|nr:hypothetical protein GYMLUDRAFT_44786 [Collybiopsis luxurians FD-317 M1]